MIVFWGAPILGTVARLRRWDLGKRRSGATFALTGSDSISDRFLKPCWRAPRGPKTQEAPKRAQDPPERPQEHPKRRPRGAKRRSTGAKTAQEAPKRSPEAPKRPEDHPKRRPRGAKRRPGGPETAPRHPKRTPRPPEEVPSCPFTSRHPSVNNVVTNYCEKTSCPSTIRSDIMLSD